MSQMPPDPPAAPPSDGAPPPAYGPPPSEPPKPGMSTRSKALIGAGAVVIVAVVAFLAFGRGDDEIDPDSPPGVVEAFYEAAGQRDCEAMIDRLSEKLWSDDGTLTRDEAVADCEDSIADEEALPEGADLDFDLASQSGDTAVVDASFTIPGRSVDVPISLVREEGAWKIDSFDAREDADEAGD